MDLVVGSAVRAAAAVLDSRRLGGASVKPVVSLLAVARPLAKALPRLEVIWQQ